MEKEDMSQENIKLAIQKKGRLSEKSIELLRLCGIEIENYSERLVVSAKNFPLDLLLLRDDDIPEYVQDGVADIGIVGEDVVCEKGAKVDVVNKLGYGGCRLMIAAPAGKEPKYVSDLNGLTIATSYPNILSAYLKENDVEAKIIELSGSVEIAPSLGVADVICDIVSTGTTLMMNKLKKSFSVFDSQAILIIGGNLKNQSEKMKILADLQRRITSVLSARRSKYLMMNIPSDSLSKIQEIIPSLKSPTVLPLADPSLLAVHAVIPTNKFWSIVDDLKAAGASGILTMSIENMII
jgi:ATP phosphoribosyltransferase